MCGSNEHASDGADAGIASDSTVNDSVSGLLVAAVVVAFAVAAAVAVVVVVVPSSVVRSGADTGDASSMSISCSVVREISLVIVSIWQSMRCTCASSCSRTSEVGQSRK
jgi:hypothetical protein